MTANSSQFEIQDTDNSTATDSDVTYLYGSTHTSHPLQVDKLKNVADRISKADVEENSVERELTDQEDPLLKINNRSNCSSVGLGQNDASWPSYTDVSVQLASTGWFQHPSIRENWKIVVGSLVLTICGFVMFLAGVGILAATGGLHSIVFFIIGFLCFVPGCYHLVYMYLALIGRPGYSFQNLPVMK